MKKKFHITEKDYIKVNKKVSREIEISLFGKSLSHHKVHKSKKLYSRKIKHKIKLIDKTDL